MAAGNRNLRRKRGESTRGKKESSIETQKQYWKGEFNPGSPTGRREKGEVYGLITFRSQCPYGKGPGSVVGGRREGHLLLKSERLDQAANGEGLFSCFGELGNQKNKLEGGGFRLPTKHKSLFIDGEGARRAGSTKKKYGNCLVDGRQRRDLKSVFTT